MRTKTTLTELQKEVTALDMAIRHLRQQVMTQLQTIITLKKALNAPLTSDEQEIFDALPIQIQTSINQSANLIASATRSNTNNQTVTYSYVQPTQTRTRKKSPRPMSRTRWTTKEENTMRKMVKEGKPFTQIATALQRSVKGCEQHWHIMNNKGK